MSFLCNPIKASTALSLLSTKSTRVEEGPAFQVGFNLPKEEVGEKGSWGNPTLFLGLLA